MKKIITLIALALVFATAYAQEQKPEWQVVSLENEWVPETAGQKAYAITTYDGNHFIVYPERDMIVAAHTTAVALADRKYDPARAGVVVRYYDENGLVTRRGNVKMNFTADYKMGVINSPELIKYMMEEDGFVRLKYRNGKYGFKAEIPTLKALTE